MKQNGSDGADWESMKRTKRTLGAAFLILSIVVVCVVVKVQADGKPNAQRLDKHLALKKAKNMRLKPETEECAKKVERSASGMRVADDVKILKPNGDGFVEGKVEDSGVDLDKLLSASVRSVLMMDKDDKTDDNLVVTMADRTKLVVDLPSCEVTTVALAAKTGEKSDLPSMKGESVGADGWTAIKRKVWGFDQGCWKDLQYHSERALRNIFDQVVVTSSDSMTHEKCQTQCAGYKYLGLEFGRECFCGTHMRYWLLGENGECNHWCTGNRGQKCGGSSRMYVYQNSGYTSVCARMPDSYSKFKGTVNGREESIGFYQQGCTISANIWRHNGHSYYLTKAFIGHLVNDWNELSLTLANNGGTWKARVSGSSGKISSMVWTSGPWQNIRFNHYA